MDSNGAKDVSSNSSSVGTPGSSAGTSMNSNPRLSSGEPLVTEGNGAQAPKSNSTIRIDDGAPYRANGNSTLDTIEEEYSVEGVTENSVPQPQSWEAQTHQKYANDLQRAKNTNTKVAKTAVKGVATYFGGPAGSAAADAVNESGVLDPIYDKIATATARAGDFNPLAQHMQKKLNEADDAGLVDMADDAIGMVGGKGKAPVQAKGVAEGASAAKEAATGGAQAAKGAESAATSKKPRGAGANPNVGGNPAGDAGNAGANAGGAAQGSEQGAKKSTPKKGLKPNKKKKDKSVKAKLFDLIKKHPMLLLWLLIGGVLAVLFIVLMSFLLGSGGYAESEISKATLDNRYDFNQVSVSLTNSYNNEQDKVQIQQLMFEDLIKGAAYAELYNSLDGLSKEQMVQLFSANMIIFRGLALNIGKYDSSTMEIELQSGNGGMPYCDINNGCDIVSKNGMNTFVISTYNGTFTGDKVSSIPKAEGDVYQALNEAYEKTKYLVMVPKSVNELMTKYDYGNPPYTQSIKNRLVTKADNNKNYETMIKEVSEYVNYKVYNLESFAMNYNYANNTSYWWPIGGKKDKSGLYSGNTSWTNISSPYGSRIHPISGKRSFHSGIDIPASQGTPIIATRSGTVKIATYNSSYGNYVEISHGDGTSSRYAHMMNGGILVAVGQTVTQGQIIGKVGTTGASTGNHLHFEIRKDGKTVNPTDYVSAKNQRPREIASNGAVVGVKGSSSTQSVCLTLKNVGFSNNAVAALMSNMHHESGFRLSALGDSGTSYGLCQWHNGRYTNLRNYCGSRLNTVECQVDYLIYELKNSYRGVYNNLLSNATADSMTTYFCMNFERPANKGVTCPNRARATSATYLNYVNNGCR